MINTEASLETGKYVIRQRASSIALHVLGLAALWILGIWVYISNDGMSVLAHSDVGVFQRTLPFALVGLFFFTLWLSRYYLAGGTFIVLRPTCLEIIGFTRNTVIQWDSIDSIELRWADDLSLLRLRISYGGGERIVATRNSNGKRDDVLSYLSNCSVRIEETDVED